MAELSGSLRTVPFAELLGFLLRLGESGCLQVSDGRRSGQVYLEAGRVASATCGSEHGRGALETIALVVPDGQFAFSRRVPWPPAESDVAIGPAELGPLLRDLARRRAELARMIPTLAAVPRLADQPDTASNPSQVVLDRPSLKVLLSVDGIRSVEDIIDESVAPGRALTGLAMLAELELIEITARPAEMQPAATDGRARQHLRAPLAAVSSNVRGPSRVRQLAGPTPETGTSGRPGASTAAAIGVPRQRAWITTPHLSVLITCGLGWVGVAAAELLTASGSPEAGVLLDLCLVLALLVLGSFSPSRERPLALAVTVAPLVRIVDLTLPLSELPLAYRYVLTSLPLVAAGVALTRVLGLSRQELGLRVGSLPLQLAIGLVGVPVAAVGYLIYWPAPSLPEPSWRLMALPALIVLTASGLPHEILFRGVLQTAAQARLGRGGLLYASALIAVLQIGWHSAPAVVFGFVISLVFAWLVASTRSLLGVVLAHGLANVGLLLIAPILAERLQGGLPR
jgi:uncharacterized protein